MIGGSSVTATRKRIIRSSLPTDWSNNVLPDTDAKHFVRATSKQSVHGSETGYTKVTVLQIEDRS